MHLMRKIKGLFVAMATVLSLSWAKNRTSHELTLKSWPEGLHFYLGEPMVLTCTEYSSEVWIYSWFRNDLNNTITPGRAHRVSHHTYSISALTFEDSGTYWCKVQKLDTDFTLLSNRVSLGVTAALPPASLEVLPDSLQHLKDEQFFLHCSVHNGDAANWTLRRLHGNKVNSGCLQMDGRVDVDKCIFENITAGLNGLYWCGTTSGDQRSNVINITVSDSKMVLQTPAGPVAQGQTVSLLCRTFYNLNITLIYKDGVSMNKTNLTIEHATKTHEGFYKCVNPTAAVESPESWLSVRDYPEDQSNVEAAWVWAVCIIITLLLLSPITILLVPSLRNRVKRLSKCGEFNAHQEMPRTKQDGTEIQWDLGWMEMSNLLDKSYTGN